MRTIGLVSSFAALLIGAPLAAQGRTFRTGDVLRSGQIPQSSQAGSRRSGARIPPGQMPPAGMCRIWIDGVPPGQQPAPTDCQTAVANKPANATVIWGDQTAFPGKGKGKFKSQNGNGRGVQNGQGRGRGSNDAENDNDDDDNGNAVGGVQNGRGRNRGGKDAENDNDGDDNGNGGVNHSRAGSTQWPVVGGMVPSSDRFSRKGKKGRGHGGD